MDPQTGGPRHMASCVLKNLRWVFRSCTNVDTMMYLPRLMGLANASTTKVASLGLFSMTVPVISKGQAIVTSSHNILYQRTAPTISNCDLYSEFASCRRMGRLFPSAERRPCDRKVNEYQVQSNGHIELPKDSTELTQ